MGWRSCLRAWRWQCCWGANAEDVYASISAARDAVTRLIADGWLVVVRAGLTNIVNSTQRLAMLTMNQLTIFSHFGPRWSVVAAARGGEDGVMSLSLPKHLCNVPSSLHIRKHHPRHIMPSPSEAETEAAAIPVHLPRAGEDRARCSSEGEFNPST